MIPGARGLFFQGLLIIAVIAIVYMGISNAITNLARAGIASGFGFFGDRAGFDIGQTIIPYTNDSNYLQAFYVGLINTLVVAIIGIFFATIIGFIVGLARLSKNYLVQKFATVYVETLRNIPLLLQLLFWYKAVLSILPSPREAARETGVEVAFSINNRGLYLPRVIPEDGSSLIFYALVIAIAAWFFHRPMGQEAANGHRAAVPGLPDRAWVVDRLAAAGFPRHRHAALARICEPARFQHGGRLDCPA